MPDKIDDNFATFGLPPCLRVPVAARSIEVLEKYVGRVKSKRVGRNGRVNAVLVEPIIRPTQTSDVGLWQLPGAMRFYQRLHPKEQLWVHVDYNNYRKAWSLSGLPEPGTDFLDHILNRRSIRELGRAHPYLRLCPVSRRTNTNAGGLWGGEGRQVTFLSTLSTFNPGIQEEVWKANEPILKMADPMDLTKMLDLSPGVMTLDGVRSTQQLFYPAN